MEKILIHWKSLLGYGFIFYVLLCFFGKETPTHVIENMVLLEDPENFMAEEDGYFRKFQNIRFSINSKGSKFDWSLFISIAVIIFSIVGVCCSVRVLINTISRFFFGIKQSQIIIQPERSLTKIPVIVKPNKPQLSDTNIKIKTKVNTDASCPNLILQKFDSTLSNQTEPITSKCQTIFKNDKLFFRTAEDVKFNKLLENQCTKLREEIAKLQASSIKERTVLSKKINGLMKEKKELSKHLTFCQKENRGAKQELEELLQEKNNLLKRVESATKELRANTKSKKILLTKLEEATTTTDNLKRELEQITRDKEILENKLKVLQVQYDKLQERVLSSQSSYETNTFHGQAPERDVYSDSLRYENRQNQTEYDVTEYSPRNKVPRLCASMSNTQYDMGNIEVEIRRLERNLEQLSSNRRDTDDFRSTEKESEGSLSNREYTSRSLRSEFDLNHDNFLINSTKLKYWGGKAGDMVQALANKMNEKVRFLQNIHERNYGESTEAEEYDSSYHENMNELNAPRKIVSGSIAFQNFLKSLQPGDSLRRHFLSQSEIIF